MLTLVKHKIYVAETLNHSTINLRAFSGLKPCVRDQILSYVMSD